jgi:hypothetical protein
VTSLSLRVQDGHHWCHVIRFDQPFGKYFFSSRHNSIMFINFLQPALEADGDETMQVK